MRLLPGGVLLRLFAFIILPFSVVFFVLAVVSVDVHGRAMRALVAARDERSAAAAAAAISEELFHRQVALRALALRLGDGVSPARTLAESGPSARDFDEGLAVASADGQIIAGSMSFTGYDRTVFTQVVASTSQGGGLLTIGEGSKSVVLAFFRSGTLTAMGAFAPVDLLRIAMPQPEAPPGRVSSIIVDPRRGVLAFIGARPLDLDYANHPGVRGSLDGKTGSTYLYSPTGEEHVLAFSGVPSARWVLLIEEPWRSVESPVLRLSSMAPLALVPVLAISLMALWFAARQIVVPLRSLQRQSMKLAAGDFAAVEEEVGGVQEIRQLQRTMTVMARNIHSTQLSLRKYIGKVTSAQEEERRRIAQDLHDETIQDLIALDQRIQLVASSLRAGRSSNARGMDAIHSEARAAIQRVRRLTRALRPTYLEDLGLVPALEAMANDASAAMGIPLVMRSDGRAPVLSQDQDLAVYRIVQEALANVTRHADARHVWIALRCRAGLLRVSVRDDGVGFASPVESGELSRAGHFGLIGMRERAQSIGAELAVSSAPGKGTVVVLSLPVPRKRARRRL